MFHLMFEINYGPVWHRLQDKSKWQKT